MLPAPAKRSIDRVRSRLFLATVAPANAEYVRRYGLQVRRGPFRGMTYLSGVERSSTDLIAKVAGTYESELHAALEVWVKDAVSLVVNVGCAEGYYAVGLACVLPGAKVLAYDIDAHARARCGELARANRVADRVEVAGECLPDTLAALPGDGVALLCDCEGYEKALLDPALAPSLRGWRIIVELHDFVDPSISDTIVSRFAHTHEIELIRSSPRRSDLPDFEFMTARQRKAALSERPVPMVWAHMWPRDDGPHVGA